MESSRLKTALKLFLLLGLPILVILGLFTFGVRVGVKHRDTVLGFEQRVFGFEVARGDDVGDDDEKDDKKGDDEKKDEDGEDDAGRADADADDGDDGADEKKSGGDDEKSGDEKVADGDAKDGDGGTVSTDDETASGGGSGTVVDAPALPPIASRPALPDDLVGAYAATRVVTVKVLVDATTVAAHPDWVDYVQRLVSITSANFRVLFGVELRLYGVMQWEVSTNAIHADALLEMVKQQPRDGADLLVAITDRGMVDGVGGSSEMWPAAAEKNGAYGVVYASPSRREPHLQGFMHELGHLMGARDVKDPESTGFRGDNFMSYAAHDPKTPPRIDADNLRRVLSAKTFPFASDTEESSHGPGEEGAN